MYHHTIHIDIIILTILLLQMIQSPHKNPVNVRALTTNNIPLKKTTITTTTKIRPIQTQQIKPKNTAITTSTSTTTTDTTITTTTTHTSAQNQHQHHRRFILSQILSLPPTMTLLLKNPTIAAASPPMTTGEADNVGARTVRLLYPKPPRGTLRPKLDKDFAVLLMRSSYNALDQLDCVPMDQFQRDFFLIRQAEYQKYTNSLGPNQIQQGDLTDPLYFDFISFAQYATISRDVSNNPPIVFEEQTPVIDENDVQRFETRVIKRDSSSREYVSNEMLPMEHERMVGELILSALDEKFRDTDLALIDTTVTTRRRRLSVDDVKVLMTKLMNLFLINGFAFDGTVSIVNKKSSSSAAATTGVDASGTTFEIKLISPATLWSGQVLKVRRDAVVNDFLLKVVKVLMRRVGYSVMSEGVTYNNLEQITTFTLV